VPEPECICDFLESCDGTGELACTGCGGDFCVCLACRGNGSAECFGCEMCGGEVDEEAFDA
jgi:hypothetical protein